LRSRFKAESQEVSPMAHLAPGITVVIPLYNKAAYVARCLRSVRSQTFQDYEVIVVDDGSTDGSAQIARLALGDPGRLVSQENRGVGAARNRGIAEAAAPYVAFLDADDEWQPRFLEAVWALTCRYPSAGLYATGYSTVWPNGKIFPATIAHESGEPTGLIKDYYNRGAIPSLIHSSSVMVAHRVFRRVGMFLEREALGEDGELWARIAYDYPIAYDTRLLGTYYAGTPSSATDCYRLTVPPKRPPVIETLRRLRTLQNELRPTPAGLDKYLEEWILFYLWKSINLPRTDFDDLARRELPDATHFPLQRLCLAIGAVPLAPQWVLRALSRYFTSGFHYDLARSHSIIRGRTPC
jgi:glycosyltransferase involved in cell wall biosynthesis